MNEELQRQLAELPFRRSADSALKTAAAAGDLARFQKAFSKSIAKPRKAFCKLFSDVTAKMSAGWEWSSPVDQEFANSLVVQVDAERPKNLFLNADSVTPLQVVVAAEWLLRSSAKATSEEFTRVFLLLANYKFGQEERATDTSIYDAPERLVASAEAPIVVSLLLIFLKTSKSIGQAGLQVLADTLSSATDTDGMLHGSIAASSFEFTAPIIRILGWAEAYRESIFSDRLLSRWQHTLEQAIAMRDRSGCVLSNVGLPTADQQVSFLLAGCELSGLAKKSHVVQCLHGQTEKVSGKRKKKSKDTKSPAVLGNSQSDWTATAVLRSRMQDKADVIGLSWHEETIQLGMSAAGQRLITGDWNCNIAVDGVEHKPVGNWVCTCWFQDDDVAFVELEQGTADGNRHVRHVVLMLSENVAILTDSVTCSDPDAEVEFASRLCGVSPRVGSLQVNPITRELRGGDDESPELRIVPAWLEDDRLIKAMGECTCVDGDLHMSAKGKGGITMPLVLDWNPVRKASEADWTNLTVTEDRVRVSPREAAGVRVRIGRLQLLIYRSLRPGKTLRAVLGYNTANETIYGRFLNNGHVDPLVMVEADA